jgi:hypothetical protein
MWDSEALLWSDAACLVTSANATHTECSCTRLGHFAVAVVADQHGHEDGAAIASLFHRVDIVGSIAAAILVFLILIAAVMVRLTDSTSAT